jgi:putative ABC transport system permease protein
VEALWRDFTFALRTFAKNPGFTSVAVLTLALGIGINAAVFTLANASLFKAFPFDNADRIVHIHLKNSNSTNRDRDDAWVSLPDFRDWREQAKSFQTMSLWTGGPASLSDGTNLPENLFASRIDTAYFSLIGQKPLIGRSFAAGEDQAGAPPVVILTYGLWERRYGKAASIIGQTVRIDGTPTTVIGVMPNGFTFPLNRGDLWLPLTPTPDTEKRQERDFVVTAKMAPGVTLKSASAEMLTITRNLQTAYPGTNQGLDAWVQNSGDFYMGEFGNTIYRAMLGAVSFVLLIACANVANLQLGRAVVRAREISIRMALGAGRWRIIRQLLVESLLLSAAGGIAGWLIAIWIVRVYDVMVTAFFKPTWMTYTMDYRVFAYVLSISIGSGILFGLAPTLSLAKLDVNTALKDGGRGSSTGRHGKRLSSMIVIGEVALAMVLLAGAGLTVRTFLNVYRAALGVNTPNVLTMRLSLPVAKYPKPADQIQFHERLKTRLAALPGVQFVSISSYLPTGGSDAYQYELEGADPVAPEHRPILASLVIAPDYFRVMDALPLSGRAFTDIDGVSGPPVVIVNQQFAGKFWPGQDPIGKRLRLFAAGVPEPWLTVVGLVPNIVQNDITPGKIDPLIYMPYRQKPQLDMAIVARTSVPPASLGTAFRKEIQSLDSDLAVYNLWTLPERLERNYWFYRIAGVMFMIFAGIALFLASIGLYATMAHSVSQRSQEIGVRMALGATARAILKMSFAQGMLRAVIGLALGLAGAFAVTRLLKAMLVQVPPADPFTFVVTSTALMAAAALGCWIPARRAMRVDPNVALRHE